LWCRSHKPTLSQQGVVLAGGTWFTELMQLIVALEMN